MKIYKLVIINIFLITTIFYSCSVRKNILIVQLMSKHNAKYWFNDKEEITFCHAIEWGDTRKMGKMLKEGIKLNKQGNTGMTFLLYSYLKSNKKSYKYLLENGADPDIEMYASEKLEFQSTMNFTVSVMSFAANEYNDSYYLEKALSHGGNPNTYISGRHILYYAVDSTDINNVKLLIESGADPDGLKEKDQEEHSTPLSFSIEDDDYYIAYYLLQKGADPEISKTDIIYHIYNHNLENSTASEKLKEYQKKVIKMLEERGFDFSPQNIQKIEEERHNKSIENIEELKTSIGTK